MIGHWDVMEENISKENCYRISVCLATFNGAVHIGEQLESILSQLNSDDELIVSDDISTDDTLDIIKNYGDARIKILQTISRLGPVANFERALSAARGEFIFLSDQDDIWEPGKVEAMLQILNTCDLVVSDCIIVNARNIAISDSFFAKRNSGPGLLKNLYKNTYLGCCMAFRTKILIAALPFPARINMHDEWIGLIAEALFRVKFLNSKLIRYRRHGRNASPELNASGFSWLKRFEIRFYKAVYLTARWLRYYIFNRTQNLT